MKRKKKNNNTHSNTPTNLSRAFASETKDVDSDGVDDDSFDEDMEDDDDDDDDDDGQLDQPDGMAAKLWMREELMSTIKDSRVAIRMAVALYF